jgi:PEP-CTERM motif
MRSSQQNTYLKADRSKSMHKILLSLLALAFVPASVLAAETISSVTFQGPASNPTITINGSGFLPEPVGDDFPGLVIPGATGQDFGGDPTVFTFNDTNGTFSFGAGQDGDNIGLNNINYTDTQITFNFGSAYADEFEIQYALEQGDAYKLFVNGLEATGIVDYAASPVPEPSTFALLGTGILLVSGLARRRIACPIF